MLVCSSPYKVKSGDYVPCSICMACRIRYRSQWATRLLLESRCHARSCVVTLTYSDQFLPDGGVLVKKHVQDFMKRLRRRYGPCRFHAVGEYGEQFGRPHYHVTIFGHYLDTDQITELWGKGRCLSDLVTQASCNYVAGYVVKKWTSASEEKLKGRPPEFSLMSLKPGIGALAVPALADPLRDQVGQLWLEGRGDVPAMYRIGQRERSIGRYLRRRLRNELGFEEKPVSVYARQTEVQSLRSDARARLRAEGKSGAEALYLESARPGHVDFVKAAAIAGKAKAQKGSL